METQRKDQTISKDRQVWEITNKKEGKKKKTWSCQRKPNRVKATCKRMQQLPPLLAQQCWSLTAKVVKTSLIKKASLFSNFLAIIPSRVKSQIQLSFPELKSSRLHPRCRLVLRLSIKRHLREFHVIVVQLRQRNVMHVMHMQSCYFAHPNLSLFWRSRSHRRRGCLISSLMSITSAI